MTSVSAAMLASIATSLVPPLDNIVGSATWALGLRKLRSAYSGSAIKVRRSSDNTTQDIGFSGNDLDTAAMLAFCGASDGFIDTWYDQSGNARNATQATTSAQPKIVSSGALITTFGGKVSAQFDGSNDRLSTAATTGIISTTALTFLVAGQVTSGGSDTDSDPRGNPAVVNPNGNDWGLYFRQSSGDYLQAVRYSTIAVNAAYAFGSAAIFGWRFNTTDGHKVYVNGGSPTSNADTGAMTNANDAKHVGGSGLGVYLPCYVSEVIAFAALASASDFNIIGNSVALDRGISWANIS